MRNNNRQHRIVRTILSWYNNQGRTLPWRNITNPYRILISEIMLQQTQVSRVLVKYPEFLRRFPTIRSLTLATQREVVMAWKGMGYNNRAVRLHKLAACVLDEHRGRIPRDYDSLIRLPGIGRYTANALLSSAFGNQLPIVDVNVQRVLSRVLWKMPTTASMRSVNDIWEVAEDILPKGRAYMWNQALMDLGATVCNARNPDCINCPVVADCASRVHMKRTNPAKLKREPSLSGIPNRMYRGRIVEQLRNLKGGRSIRVDILAKRIHPLFTRRNEEWLRQLIGDLQKDGLITVRGKGTLTKTSISLA